MSRQASPSRLLFATLLCLLLLPAIRMPAQADPQRHGGGKHARQQIVALEEQWRTATIAGDAATMDKLLSEDYVGISWTGQVNTKAMQLDRVRTRTVQVSRMDLSDIKVKILGPVAVVTCRAEVDSTNDGNETSGEFRYTRVYQRLPSGVWKITNFEATRIPSGPRGHKPPAPPNA
jgi:ketosteroid isomerase-like protein